MEPRHLAALLLAYASGFLSFAGPVTTYYDGGMEPAVNPYESPQEITEPALPADELALRRLVHARLIVPSLALTTLGGGQGGALLLAGLDFFATAESFEWQDPRLRG
jgi:hypothetical protein